MTVVEDEPRLVRDRLEKLRRLEIARVTNQDVWEEFPHQIVPPGNWWYLWLLLAGRGAGKALHLNTPIPTPNGWTYMGNVKVGEQLLDEQGRPCLITAVSPVMLDHDCYRVRFSDGSEIVADAEHRWHVWSYAYRKAMNRRVGGGDHRKPQCQPHLGPEIITTLEMIGRLRQEGRGDLNLSVPVTKALRLPEKSLPIDPYVLGAWLGDGHLHSASITTMDREVVAGITGAGFRLEAQKHQNAGAATTYSIRHESGSRKRSLHRSLRRLGLLKNEKRIPIVYLRSSIAQRQMLLMGLMDTDGHVDKKGSCEFAVVTKGLAEDVEELVVSLGWKATFSSRSLLGGGFVYRVRFRPDLPVVTVPRKLERIRAYGRQGSRHLHRMVVSIEPVDSAPVRCIAVDSPSHLYLAGRSMIPTHNTDACAAYFDRFMRWNAGARGGIVAPTIGDAAEACVHGPSGLMAHNPTIRVFTRTGGTFVSWPNGSEARLFGTHTNDDVNRLRAGGNRHLYWVEELAAWRYLKEAWENMEFGLRLGTHPHIIGSTTPKTRPFLKRLMEEETTVISKATTFDNPKLPPSQLERLRNRYQDTRLGQQELMGLYLEDVEGAMWTYELLSVTRRTIDEIPDMARVVVAVDPSGGDEEGNDEQGIIVCGRGVDGQGYVLADRSCKESPEGWGRRAIQAYIDFKADRIVGEINFGGALVMANIKAVSRGMGENGEGIEVATKTLTASRGKVARAEPIASLYEQNRCHNVGTTEDLEELEYQQRMWTPDSGWSPDRMDAAVWGLTELMLDDSGPIPVRTYRTKARIPTGGDRFTPGLGI